MANRSTFPTQIDTFIEHMEIKASDKPLLIRYQELMLKANLTVAEGDELQILTGKLRDKLQTAEDFNKLQDAIVNLQNFFRDQVDGFIIQKQGEMNNFVSTKQNEINQEVADFIVFVSDKETYITNYTDDRVLEMQQRRDSFTAYVDIKENEIRTMVQEFNSNSARYYQRWIATNGQTDFNIYNGDMTNVPAEAKLNINEINIDLIINGVEQTPNVDFEIVGNGNYDTIKILSGAVDSVSSGTEVVAKWYKNVGKLYFKHSSTHELGGRDEIKNIQEAQLHQDLQKKLNSDGIVESNVKPIEDVAFWFKVIG